MKRWKKLTLCFVSFFTCFFAEIAIDVACGPQPDPYDYYASFFHNTIQGNDNYRSFYFNGYLFLNDDNNLLDEQDINAKEWAGHLGKPVSARDVGKAMYWLDTKSDSLLLLNYLKPDSRLPDSLRKNTFLKALVSGKHNDALAYYRFTKSVAKAIDLSYDKKWAPIPLNDKNLLLLAREALQKAKKTKNLFINLRYYYQAQHLMFYTADHREAINIYNKHIAGSKSQSHVIGWALSLRAGSELNVGNPAKAAFLFSKVFANYPERRIQSFYDFDRIHEPQASIIKFAKTANEKAFVYTIGACHKPRVDITGLEQVYKVQPGSPLIKLLLVREINKIEESYLSKKLDKTAHHNPYDYQQPYTGEDSTVKKQIAYMPKLKAFCRQLATEGRYAEPAVANLAVAYLSWMQGNNSSGFEALEAIGADYDSDRKAVEYYDADFLKTANAEKYYLKARALSQNLEFKARCTFMAANCNQNSMLFLSNRRKSRSRLFSEDRYNTEALLKHNPYFTELRKTYSKTAYYKLTVMDCTYYQDFLHAPPGKSKQNLKVIVK
jgi:hypothetical protein